MLKIENVSLSFGGIHAVQDVSCEISAGEIFSVIGPNGAGKTSLFNAITGLYRPTSGQVTLNNDQLTEPFNSAVILRALGVVILTAFIVEIAFYAQELWVHVIANNYLYLQLFPWRKAFVDCVSFVSNRSLLPAAIAGITGGIGSLIIWSRSRLTPSGITRRGIARTFQNIRLLPHMTTKENLIVALDRSYGGNMLSTVLRLPVYRRREEDKVRVATELLTFVGLEDKSENHANSLPYGLQRRLEIGRALALRPKLLLLDEPAAGLNTQESESLVELIRKIRDTGITVVLIEHHMKVVMGISDRILVMDQGKVLACGDPASIQSNPDVIRAYLGEDVDAQH